MSFEFGKVTKANLLRYAGADVELPQSNLEDILDDDSAKPPADLGGGGNGNGNGNGNGQPSPVIPVPGAEDIPFTLPPDSFLSSAGTREIAIADNPTNPITFNQFNINFFYPDIRPHMPWLFLPKWVTSNDPVVLDMGSWRSPKHPGYSKPGYRYAVVNALRNETGPNSTNVPSSVRNFVGTAPVLYYGNSASAPTVLDSTQRTLYSQVSFLPKNYIAKFTRTTRVAYGWDAKDPSVIYDVWAWVSPRDSDFSRYFKAIFYKKHKITAFDMSSNPGVLTVASDANWSVHYYEDEMVRPRRDRRTRPQLSECPFMYLTLDDAMDEAIYTEVLDFADEFNTPVLPKITSADLALPKIVESGLGAFYNDFPETIRHRFFKPTENLFYFEHFKWPAEDPFAPGYVFGEGGNTGEFQPLYFFPAYDQNGVAQPAKDIILYGENPLLSQSRTPESGIHVIQSFRRVEDREHITIHDDFHGSVGPINTYSREDWYYCRTIDAATQNYKYNAAKIAKAAGRTLNPPDNGENFKYDDYPIHGTRAQEGGGGGLTPGTNDSPDTELSFVVPHPTDENLSFLFYAGFLHTQILTDDKFTASILKWTFNEDEPQKSEQFRGEYTEIPFDFEKEAWNDSANPFRALGLGLQGAATVATNSPNRKGSFFINFTNSQKFDPLNEDYVPGAKGSTLPAYPLTIITVQSRRVLELASELSALDKGDKLGTTMQFVDYDNRRIYMGVVLRRNNRRDVPSG